jgi:hypothetical protein
MDTLVIKSTNPKDTGRISCVKLHSTLFALFEKCKNDRDYASKPAPWDKRQKGNEIVEEAVETNVAKVAADILERKRLRIHNGKTQRRVIPDFPASYGEESQTVKRENSDSVVMEERKS